MSLAAKGMPARAPSFLPDLIFWSIDLAWFRASFSVIVMKALRSDFLILSKKAWVSSVAVISLA